MAESPKKIVAKWSGKCSKCGAMVVKGSEVLWVSGVKGVSHVACPAGAKPAVWASESVEPVAAGLESEIAAAEVAHKAASEAASAAVAAWIAVAVPLGYCASCHGSGWVHAGYDSDYECGPGHKGYEAVNAASPEAAALWAASEAAKSKEAIASGTLKVLRAKLAEALEVKVGCTVKVVKGKKVPKGTEGVVIWKGSGNWGPRVGIKAASGEVHWTAESNVEVIAHGAWKEAA